MNQLKHWKIETRTFSSTDCAVVEGETQAGTRTLLRFPAGFPNLGPGDLIIGNPLDHPELFDFVTCHGHPHFKEYADYRLWTLSGWSDWDALRAANPGALARDLLEAHPELASQMVAGAKQGFCSIDVYRYATRERATYTSCIYNQGISVGWGDLYGPSLDGQWVDITNLAPGKYMLEVEVNAEQLFEEEDYSNNRGATAVTISAGKKK